VFKDAQNEFRWRLVASSGEIVAASEAYSRRRDAKRGIAAHQRAAATTTVVVLD
jgi:uncharacterized protein YegP (UPF0339 family)